MGSLTRCQNGYMLSARRYGIACPYCYIKTMIRKKWKAGSTEEGIEEMLSARDLVPICGWTMRIPGARQDKDHKIKFGKNSIGRANDMDIQILGDSKIFRRNHSVIVFDLKKRGTAILLGDSNDIVYPDNNAVYTPTVLKSHDVIEMGDSKLVSVPFCDESFMWGDDGEKS